MKLLLFICSGLLILAIADLPIGYYTFLRIVVTIGAIAVISQEYDKEISSWIVVFGLIGILFNPIIPIYLHDKDSWLVIDLIVAVLFGYKAIKIKHGESTL